MSLVLTLSQLEAYDPRSRNGREQQRFLCPLCGDEKPRDAAHRSLSLHVPTGKWLCHRCGARGWLGDGQSSALKQAASIVLQVDLPSIEPKPTNNDFDWQGAWQQSLALTRSPATAYLQYRGIPIALARAAGVRYAPRWHGRPAVLFPLHNQTHQLAAVSGRFLSNRVALKTLTGGAKRLGVFATPSAWRSSRIALTEGPFDALSLAHCQLPALALMGTSWPEWLPENLCGKQVFIATDADKAGDEAADALTEMLTTAALHCLRLRPPSGKDWNEVLMRVGRKSVCDAIHNVWL